MKVFIFLALIIMIPSVQAEVESDFSGNLEAQGRHSWNNDLAKEDLLQDWDEENFYLVYGNLNGKVEFKNSRIEANLFGRYSYSNLYQDNSPRPDYVAPLIYTYPNKLVARDMFKLSHEEQGDNYKQEYVLNKLYYEWDYDDNRFMLGRMYINYGLGEIFNPINPFNQPTALTSISQVAQGNDGLNFTFYINEYHTLDFFFLGDKSLDEYNGDIERTLWIHGEYQVNNELQFDYVAGQDQRRNKLGGQVRYNFEEAMVFTQAFYQSGFTDDVNDEKSHSLWDVLLGYDQQLTNKWHIRTETGYQQKNKYLSANQVPDRFLPTEYFLALANTYDIHPLVKLGGTFIFDIKSGFTYFVTRNTLDLGHNTEMDLFAYLPLAKGDGVEIPAQKLVTTDVGLAIRKFF